MKFFSVKGEFIIVLAISIFAAVCIACTYISDTEEVYSAMPLCDKTVVIDAGHGGWDPGKTGNSGDDEKDINLEIAKYLQMYLEQVGANVYMTRVEDEALSDKKSGDMKERKNISQESDADIFVSIHQNAFPTKTAKGAQVFYHKDSEESKRLAGLIQQSIKELCDNENTRQIKANDDYYILKNIEQVSVIVECGFISNPEEEKKLNDEQYKKKMAWAIYSGIAQYFRGDNMALNDTF